MDEPGTDLSQEHERLARELHDLAITRLSQLGFDLCSISGLVSGIAHERIGKAVQDVDDIIRDLRLSAVARLDPTGDPHARSPGSNGTLESGGAPVRTTQPPRGHEIPGPRTHRHGDGPPGPTTVGGGEAPESGRTRGGTSRLREPRR